MTQKKRRIQGNHFSMRDALRDKHHVRTVKPPSNQELGLLNDIKRRGYIQIDSTSMAYTEYQRQYNEHQAFADRHGVMFVDGGNWFAVGTPESMKQLAGD